MGRRAFVGCCVALACSSSGREDESLTLGSGITAVDGGSEDESDTDDDEDSTGEVDPSDGEPKLDVNAGMTSGITGGDGGECPCENVLDGIYVLHSPGIGQPSIY